MTYLAKAEYFDSWKTAWFFRAAGQIPIRRTGGSASERALETARTGVTVNAVCPGYVETPMAARVRSGYAEHWGVTDELAMMAQIGVLPQEYLAAML